MAGVLIEWKSYLLPEHYDVPLHALNYALVKHLALYLDGDVMMRNGVVPNFAGCAELAGFNYLEITRMERAPSPTKQFFDDWKDRSELNPTVGRFVEFLAILGRVDVLSDSHQLIVEDVTKFLNKSRDFNKMAVAPIQDNTVSSGPGFEELPRLITRQDVENNRETIYDAFICYNPVGNSSHDLTFVRELIQRYEDSNMFTLFVPYRDDLPGLNDHSINAKIISERCKHMIVVLSKNFLSSPACEFQSTFAHALSPSARSKRIIPIKIQDCPTPSILKIMACCDFTKRDLREWSWDRLKKSIMMPIERVDYEVTWKSSLTGMLRTSDFDLNSSTLDSGFDCPMDSSRSSRSSSPAPNIRPTNPTTSRSAEIIRQAPNRTTNVGSMTAPVALSQPGSASGSGGTSGGPLNRLRNTLFSSNSKKVKAKDSPQSQ